ncbi:MAG TPA: TIM barrel protein [Blastocatellia bacterium]|nr:TIM barrel protein [Blastocatellia bacterium]
MKIGTAPVSWGIIEAEGWSGIQTYGTVLDEMNKAGYAGTELGPYGYLPTDPDRLNSELSSRELKLVSAFVPVHLADPARHKSDFDQAMKVARLLNNAGAGLIVLADEMNGPRMAVAGRVDEERDGMSASKWSSAIEILSQIAHASRELGLLTAFHHHAGTLVETPAEIERLCSSMDPALIGLCLDTGHYVYGGGEPVEAVDKYSSRILHVHLKDVRLDVLQSVKEDRVGFLDAVSRGVFCEIGDGAVNVPVIAQKLTKCGYDEWLIVEQDVDVSLPGVNPFESACRSRQYLREVVGL